MRRAPEIAAAGMIQLIAASSVASPKYETAAAEPAVSKTPRVTQRRRVGAGLSLILHSKRAKMATSTSVTATSTAIQIGRVSHHAQVPGSILKATPSRAKMPTAPTSVIADRCHR